MNKNDFLIYLEQGLIDHGIDPALASKHVSHFGKTISKEDEDEIDAIDNPADLEEMIEGMADFLKQRIQQKKKAQEQNIQGNPDFADIPTMEVPAVQINNDKKTLTSVADDDTAVVDVQKRANTTASVPKQRPREAEVHHADVPQMRNTQTVNTSQREARPPEERRNRDDNGRKDESSTPKIQFDFDSIEYSIPEATTKGKAIFWGTFAVTLPFTAFLFVGITAVFFGLIIGFSVLIAGIIAGLVAMVAAGSAISLVGVIYGITQLFVSFPIGLYEIGLGVIITGFMMLAGILLYNFAIRLLPFVIRKVYEFFKLYLKSVKYLFNYLKGRCYSI